MFSYSNNYTVSSGPLLYCIKTSIYSLIALGSYCMMFTLRYEILAVWFALWFWMLCELYILFMLACRFSWCSEFMIHCKSTAVVFSGAYPFLGDFHTLHFSTSLLGLLYFGSYFAIHRDRYLQKPLAQTHTEGAVTGLLLLRMCEYLFSLHFWLKLYTWLHGCC